MKLSFPSPWQDDVKRQVICPLRKNEANVVQIVQIKCVRSRRKERGSLFRRDPATVLTQRSSEESQYSACKQRSICEATTKDRYQSDWMFIEWAAMAFWWALKIMWSTSTSSEMQCGSRAKQWWVPGLECTEQNRATGEWLLQHETQWIDGESQHLF